MVPAAFPADMLVALMVKSDVNDCRLGGRRSLVILIGHIELGLYGAHVDL